MKVLSFRPSLNMLLYISLFLGNELLYFQIPDLLRKRTGNDESKNTTPDNNGS